ncbi:hypothetical protein GALMADRAFT_63037 [Galerina marginata CBS 339.88]|uniref:RBR-type E3 ubiquitin transferase n=1 Tax=Galerina marginata (strain CBS 339.88) TaxID=685588 RepID=A0A067TJM9_GALM3|nr:hypothetical protein GALMADRAFT_63037 [Galerina marginata CBS 339.88]
MVLPPEESSSTGPSTSFSRSSAFECGICGDQLLAPEAMRIPVCQHTFCGECLRTYTSMKLREQRYPIACPSCLADGEVGGIEHEIIEKLNLQSKDMDKLMELQMSVHAVSLNCPSCKKSMHVDRQDYVANNILTCPLPPCQYKWCRDCEMEIGLLNTEHHCKNKKLDRLMRRKGWKYCPGCRTPIQKESGCNHMACGSPGCNVHFCYKCGDLIVDTSTGGNLGLAIGAHYTNCKQYEHRLVTLARGYCAVQ